MLLYVGWCCKQASKSGGVTVKPVEIFIVMKLCNVESLREKLG